MKTYWFDYFSGGVPSLDYFLLQVEQLCEFADTSDAEKGEIDFTAELCLVGLAAYFEAYCKNQFAAIVNICPETTRVFAQKRGFAVPLRDLLHIATTSRPKLGFIVAEQCDFGSAKSINSLFHDLLHITPFARDEVSRYSEFLTDRNLLVHHGGVFTIRYVTQRFTRANFDAPAHYGSLVVNKDEVHVWAKFLSGCARKIGTASKEALARFIVDNKIKCGAERRKAVEALQVPLPSAHLKQFVSEIKERVGGGGGS